MFVIGCIKSCQNKVPWNFFSLFWKRFHETWWFPWNWIFSGFRNIVFGIWCVIMCHLINSPRKDVYYMDLNIALNFDIQVPAKMGKGLNKANLRDLIAATGLVISHWIKIVNFSARVTVKFVGLPCKTIGHLFYATSSFVRHFVAIGEFKLELQSGNGQSGSNSTIFRAVRPWNLMDDLAKQ